MKSSPFTLPTLVAAIAGLPSIQAASLLGTAESFAVLGASADTSAGALGTLLNGDLGVYPGLSITGFPPGVVNGTIYHGGPVAGQARTDALAAFTTLANEISIQDLTGQDLGGLTLTPGVRHFDSSAQLTGVLTLNALGNPNARFDFQIGSTLTTASGSMIQLLNGANPDNIYWQVGSSAVLGTTTFFLGNLLADQSITLNTRATLACGRALALNGAVTLDENIVGNICLTAPPIPEASFYGFLTYGIPLSGAWRWRIARSRPSTRR